MWEEVGVLEMMLCFIYRRSWRLEREGFHTWVWSIPVQELVLASLAIDGKTNCILCI